MARTNESRKIESGAYWRRRAEILEAARNREAGRLTADIKRQFSLAERAIDERIEQWYSRFAANNQITLTEARQWLVGKDLAEFKWDVAEYIKRGREAGLSQEYIKQLENASARFHISKLEALKLRARDTVETLYGQFGQKTASLLGQIYEDNYYHMAYTLQQGVGVGWDIAALDPRQIESALAKPWTLDRETFSDRIWSRKEGLINELRTQLTQNLILGKGPGDAIKAIASKFGASWRNANRLVMTESAYFATEAQRKAFNDLDVDEFEVVATLDGATCPVCGAYDGQHLPMPQFEAGVTVPPFHPLCRCCVAPWFEDGDGQRFARDPETGKSYYVPADMKYEEWKRRYVDKTEPKRIVALATTNASGGLSAGGGGGTMDMRNYMPLDDTGIVALQQQSDETYGRFTKGSRLTEKDAIDGYTDGGHGSINPYLYGKMDAPEAVLRKYADDTALMDSAIAKFSLDRDIVVYSGTSLRHYADWKVGDVKTIPAYLSTAAREKFAKEL
jgi:SPP1 gp7 family putative phage head morphogenesis protein